MTLHTQIHNVIRLDDYMFDLLASSVNVPLMKSRLITTERLILLDISLEVSEVQTDETSFQRLLAIRNCDSFITYLDETITYEFDPQYPDWTVTTDAEIEKMFFDTAADLFNNNEPVSDYPDYESQRASAKRFFTATDFHYDVSEIDNATEHAIDTWTTPPTDRTCFSFLFDVLKNQPTNYPNPFHKSLGTPLNYSLVICVHNRLIREHSDFYNNNHFLPRS